MQPIATPDRTIDWTIGSGGAVAGGQIERAFLERVRLDHHALPVRVTVVLIRRERDLAIDAREIFQGVPVGDDLFRLEAVRLDRRGGQARSVVRARETT